MYNAGDRKDIRRAEKDVRVAELIRVEFLQASLRTIQGRAWFHDILEFCHLFNDPFSGDALLEAYTKGERNIGLRIFADILAHCPDQYITMMREANERRSPPTEQSRSQNLGRDADQSSDGSADGGLDPYDAGDET